MTKPEPQKKCACGEFIPFTGTRCRLCRNADIRAAYKSARKATTCRVCGEAVPPEAKGVCALHREDPMAGAPSDTSEASTGAPFPHKTSHLPWPWQYCASCSRVPSHVIKEIRRYG